MFPMTFLWQKAVKCLVLVKSVHYGNFPIGGNKMSWGRDAFPRLQEACMGWEWPCLEAGLARGDWKREKEGQGMISAFPGQSLGHMATQ